jgi:hypothetical protein
MTEKAYGFSSSVIDELNRHPGSQRPSTKEFTLLLIGLAVLVLLFYVQIVW